MTATTQSMQALAYANEVRTANANFRRTVAAMTARGGAEYVADAIECDYGHETIGALPVDRMLLSVHKLGSVKAAKCLTAAGVVNHGRRLRELTPRQRKAVAMQLRLWAVGYGR
jgi:hypothetical protein